MSARDSRPGEYSEAATAAERGHDSAESHYGLPCPDCGARPWMAGEYIHAEECLREQGWTDPDPEADPRPTTDLPLEQWREHVRSIVRREPGISLPKLAERLDVKPGRVSAALREPRYFEDVHGELPPVPGRFTDPETARRYIGWSYPSSPRRYEKFLRDHLENTFGDIYNLDRFMRRVEAHFGAGAVPDKVRDAIENLLVAVDIHRYWFDMDGDDDE